ncbi:hypothetical protein CCYS_03885 [Corynebacterium cystitidis DSM 20524]|uniref:Uncharacterized protein n=1 Tax=Corynebacterium cystitidis DSM 20524 TaxID=1121357 RepID=A0A1H9QKV2_9CORY|nr:hypothetical protein CCYS_03885 [Corynebacterium cystitidis DSM 20524]SER61074.1 hypothetical protein SAMN05661109_00589 [Corynebacterium cystitidis DSM 20524]SNV84243.1 Uncharacterised protein [Corynebacterium cystitidis]
MPQPNQELFNLIFHNEQDYTLIPDQLADHLNSASCATSLSR